MTFADICALFFYQFFCVCLAFVFTFFFYSVVIKERFRRGLGWSERGGIFFLFSPYFLLDSQGSFVYRFTIGLVCKIMSIVEVLSPFLYSPLIVLFPLLKYVHVIRLCFYHNRMLIIGLTLFIMGKNYEKQLSLDLITILLLFSIFFN